MAKAKLDPAVLDHLEWLGFVRPIGLVVSAPALVRAGAILDRRDIDGQQRLRACTEERVFPGEREPTPWFPDFRRFAESVLGWSFSPKGYAGTDENPIPAELEVDLPDHGDTLRPDFAVRELEPEGDAPPWQLLVRVLNAGQSFDEDLRGAGRLEASPHSRMERLLRRTGVTAGLLFNGRSVRLLSTPPGESSGWLDFHVAEMVQTAGRPISTATRMLLGQSRLLSLPRAQRLAALLADSRKFQNEVSERLAEQVLHALYELLRGFQAAHDASKSELLREPLAENPDKVYRALLTVILRLVFLLYAEERDMLPQSETFVRYYSLAGLFERLREDAALHPDTMDQRYGAWAQLVVLFRLVHDGADLGDERVPPRHGVLFDPDRFPFLEGRTHTRQLGEQINAPLVPDGTIYRALEKLLVLDGERLSYRALDVEQIGSVYETMMGFRLETASGRSVAVKAQKKHGAPTAIDLDALLAEPAAKRGKWIKDRADRKLTDRVLRTVKDATTLEDLHAALQPVIDDAATPDLVPPGAMVLQPSEERRRSGSHYTPRALTEPIVRTTLEPILARLRGDSDGPLRPEQILDLKVCDPAMGSGAFLVEACRQLGDALVEAWRAHDAMPTIPADETDEVFARRLVAQRCLYGVDRNPVAVDLAKVSLWLVTLAKDHSLTFVDHALRYGDSLVGLSRRQIERFHWDPNAPAFTGFERTSVREHTARIANLRQRIRESGDNLSDSDLRDLWHEAQGELARVRLFGDLVIAAYFEGSSARAREAKRNEFGAAVAGGEADQYLSWLEERRHTDAPLAPFHWQVEFPEVFERENPGFEAVIGNPPFLGAKEFGITTPSSHLAFLKRSLAPITGKTDLVAYFFRRAWTLIRQRGTFGLIATNTIAQGDTHASGLLEIHRGGGAIYSARRRMKWPGTAAVVVSVVHVSKGHAGADCSLDGRPATRISTYLFEKGPDEPPAALRANAGLAGKGIIHSGDGFIFAGEGSTEEWPLSLAHQLREDPELARAIKPLWGSREINNSPDFHPIRFVIDFGDRSEATVLAEFPRLHRMVTERVRPARMALTTQAGAAHAKRYWWQFTYRAEALIRTLQCKPAMLAIGRVTPWHALCRLPSTDVPSEQAVAFAACSDAAFCALQARPHEIWARFFGSSLEDRLRYTPSDCFETFPLPPDWEGHPALEAAGNAYYEHRAALMVRNDEGLTRTYNRFHAPDERSHDILELRELHAAMDRAVLGAYGWTDVPTNCEFLLDYEIDEKEWSPRRRKPYRYRWPDDIRDEVLARLLELNAERAAEEARAGVQAGPTRTRNPSKKADRTSTDASEERGLFS